VGGCIADVAERISLENHRDTEDTEMPEDVDWLSAVQ
jgi:hypothetical protein